MSHDSEPNGSIYPADPLAGRAVGIFDYNDAADRIRRPAERSENVLVTLTTRHMDLTEPLKHYAEQKAGKLVKYYDRIQEIEVIFDNGKDTMRVEMIVNAEHKNLFVAHHDDGDAYACVDGCVDKLERQLSEHKKMYRNRKHPDQLTPRRGGSEG